MLEADEALAAWIAARVPDGTIHYRQAPLNTKPPYYEYWCMDEDPWIQRGFQEDIRRLVYVITAVSLESVDAAQRFATLSNDMERGTDRPVVPGWSQTRKWEWTGRYTDDYDVLVDGDPVYREGAMYEVILRRT